MKEINLNQIHFEKATSKHQPIIFHWLDLPHMKEFWDNSQAHRDDILNFINGRKQQYFYGTTIYWVGYFGDQPFCFILSNPFLSTQEMTQLHRSHLSASGHTIGLDFGIGNIDFLGKGFAAPTLELFTAFYRKNIDPKADTFFIDPDQNNPRATHVYIKAGFEMAGEFMMEKGFFKGQKSCLLVKKFI
jgi:RimJ/RimL family protein N-acetyltransferase